MDQLLILETTLLVDLEREAHAGNPGPAHTFLEDHPDRGLAITLTTAGELACGPDSSSRRAWERLLSRFRILEPNRETAWRYGQLYRFLKRNGTLIGTNDLWIAATALTHGAPLVTRNLRDFQRVPDLEVLGY
ncbi:MAG: type II toxin-antitoxin system VapC family toxin [Gemmatimonadota bacterium]